MNKITLFILSFFILSTIHAEDKLDILDQQSKEFFNAITGLEKDYLEEQVKGIKTQKKNVSRNTPVNVSTPMVVEKEITQDEYAKNIFKHENDMARLTTDFTRTKKLKDLKIKSMYKFNGKNYVVLKLDENKSSSSEEKEESTFNIEGRYTYGDYILTHKIVSINTRTKTVRLYKKLDEEYGYSIHLSNYGISVSDLKKIPKKEVKSEKKSVIKAVLPEKENKEETSNKIQKLFDKTNSRTEVSSNETIEKCFYTVNVSSLNVRNKNNLDGTILRLLKSDDKFTIQNKIDSWLQIDTIHKKVSGDIMIVKNENNWIQVFEENVILDKNCS